MAQLDSMKVERTFPDKSFLYIQGMAVDGIYHLLAGVWQLTRANSQNDFQVLEFLKPGDIVGVVPLFDGHPSPYGIQSLGESRCYFYPGQAVRSLVMGDPGGMDAVLQHFAHRIRHLIGLADLLSLHSVPERAAALLLARLRPGSSIVEFQEDQETLSHYLGCTRSAFNRALRMLSNQGFIRTTFPVVRILDFTALARLAGESPNSDSQARKRV